jgi:hypothetical protein
MITDIKIVCSFFKMPFSWVKLDNIIDKIMMHDDFLIGLKKWNRTNLSYYK